MDTWIATIATADVAAGGAGGDPARRIEMHKVRTTRCCAVAGRPACAYCGCRCNAPALLFAVAHRTGGRRCS
jgi:hypothetical protein